MAVPLGILGAVYLHEYGGQRPFARFVRFMAYVMTGVPSIVMGLFVYVVWTLRFGFSAFGGALALACLMLPIVIRSVEEMLQLVPHQPAGGQLRARRPQEPHHPDGRAPRGAARRRERLPAGRRPRRR